MLGNQVILEKGMRHQILPLSAEEAVIWESGLRRSCDGSDVCYACDPGEMGIGDGMGGG